MTVLDSNVLLIQYISTTGGTGGTTTTVSNLAALSTAAAASGPGVIVVSGAISGAAKVQVGSNKSIIGKAGSST